jgi:Uma2 family endonuclease
MATPTQATLADLYRLPDNAKAELVNGELVLISPTGDLPSSASGIIYASLLAYARRTKSGRAYGDNTGFIVKLPHRRSFSPDAAFHTGERTGMRFLEGAPVFAVEVRSENDYGPTSERALAEKRADYFATGTQVVWDVDLLSKEVVKVYRASDLDTPTIYRRGELAEAEPAVPGWTLAVDELYE